jgi:hypothetical protein
MATPHRELKSKAARRKLPAKAEDGTPYCVTEHGRRLLYYAVLPQGPARA